ncbi:uncharacterized protein LOC126781882 [Nymphalis io]|uniref:uncharacterized protein LOC126781882 n=1 Tax=Inachis io TaxID=171585 RepID=UPI0021689925|nr:uncharacterized protein LOC126781882 [Nymphalis io]
MADNLEKLTADILDEDFTSIFRPLHILQAVIGSLNVKIEHGFATPPSRALMTIVDVVMSLFILYYIQIRVEYIRKELENIKSLVESNSKLHKHANAERAQLDETLSVGLEKKLTGLVLGTHDILTAMADFSHLYQMKISYFTYMMLLWVVMLIELSIIPQRKGVVKRNAKRMFLLLDVRNSISIYDIYTLDARLLARTLGIITTYTVIILQFYVA